MLFWCRIITDDILMKSLLIVTGGPYIDLMYESMTFILVDLFKVTFVNPFKFQRHSRQSNIVLTIKNFFLIFYCFYYENLSLAPFGFTTTSTTITFHDPIPKNCLLHISNEYLSSFIIIDCVLYVLCKAIIFGSENKQKTC